MAEVIKKKVNVRAFAPIVDLKFPIAGVANGITLTTDEILICIRSKAKVEEIIGNKTIPLDFANYDKDNSVQEVKPEPEQAKILNVVEVNGKLVIDETPVDQEVKVETPTTVVPDPMTTVTTETKVTEPVSGVEAVKEDSTTDKVAEKDTISKTQNINKDKK
jgi:hypothetical protein